MNLGNEERWNWREAREIALRRRWWFLGPFFFFCFLGFGVAHAWPELYQSEALILVEQQKVPQQYVLSNVITNLQERLQSMTQQILSRSRLKSLIEKYNLYPRERARTTMDEVIDKMRKRIRIELVETPGRQGELTAFRIYFLAETPQTAQQIANELTSLFIEENLEARTQQSAGTTNFLGNELEQASKDLQEQEHILQDFKSRYLGQLPEQQQTNLQILSSLEAELQATSAALQRSEQERIYLESMQAEYGSLQQSLGTASGGARVVPASVLRNLRSRLTELEAKYTPRHPDVVKLKAEIARWEALQGRLKDKPTAGQPDQAGQAAASSGGGDATSIETESRLKAIQAQTKNLRKEADRLNRRIREMQARLNLVPLREQQLADVMRNYQNAQEHYKSLLQKKFQSELATNMERRQQGEQFRIIDPASLPRKPAEPNRLQITLFGWLLGLCAGIGLAAVREATDTTVRTEIDLYGCGVRPVLVRIPFLRTPGEENWQRWKLPVEVASASLCTLLSVATVVYTWVVR